MIAAANYPKPGTRVFCKYRANSFWHYLLNDPADWDFYNIPLMIGEVLPLDDPRAWTGTSAFPDFVSASRDAVTEHVNRAFGPSFVAESVPVLYRLLYGSVVLWDNKLITEKEATVYYKDLMGRMLEDRVKAARRA